VSPNHLDVIPMGAFRGETDRHAVSVGMHIQFGADPPAVSRMFADLSPPKGALVMAPLMASHSQSMPCKAL
jgi:hypothetical protein